MENKISKEAEEKIADIQLLEQNLQNFLMQKQTLQAQLIETDSAFDELDKSDISYKIIGNIMVKSDKKELKDQLEQKKNIIELRIKSIEKQEEKIREKMKKLQSEVMSQMGE